MVLAITSTRDFYVPEKLRRTPLLQASNRRFDVLLWNVTPDFDGVTHRKIAHESEASGNNCEKTLLLGRAHVVPNVRAERRGAQDVEMQTGRSSRVRSRPLVRQRSAHNFTFPPA